MVKCCSPPSPMVVLLIGLLDADGFKRRWVQMQKSSNEGEVGFGAQHPGADGFKMPDLALKLLGHGVHVAEAAFQRMILEDRGSAGGVVGEVDRLARLVDGI